LSIVRGSISAFSTTQGPSCRIAEAEARRAVDLVDDEAVMRLEPDAVVVDDADDRDRDLEAARRERGDAVEGAVGRRVEDVVSADGGEPGRLVRRHGGFHTANDNERITMLP
jgi:hypothetical protein